jgi:AAA15 family ATPase/GTPase
MILKENQVIKDNSSYDIIKIIYITPYDHFKDGLINKTIENIKESEKDKIIKLLQMFDSNILDFKTLSTNNKDNPMTTYIKHKKYGFMPLFSFGDSIKKVLTLASAVISAKQGILLVDEIETAIHKNMINEVFKWFIEACKEFEVQLICTTHSLEAIDGMIMGVGKQTDSLSCFRIEIYDEKIYGAKFSGNKLKDIRTLLGQDVR